MLLVAALCWSSCQDDPRGWYDNCTADSQCASDLFCAEAIAGYDFCTSACISNTECQNQFGTQSAICGVDSLCYRYCEVPADCPAHATCELRTCIVLELPDVGFCGNGAVEGSEECDGANLGGSTCITMGWLSGSLSCSSTCWLDTSDCADSDTCGDGIATENEECDLLDLGDVMCMDIIPGGNGILACYPDCTYDTSGCSVCGNGVRETYEECDCGYEPQNLPPGCPDINGGPNANCTDFCNSL